MNNFVKFSLILLIGFSCNSKQEETTTETVKNEEISLVQEPNILKSDKGDSISITYFAKGDMAAMKLKINDKEYELLPTKNAPNGNPCFGNEEYIWEIFNDGKSGRLVDLQKNETIYRQ